LLTEQNLLWILMCGDSKDDV